jgi:molybdopterin adenylyltransferase
LKKEYNILNLHFKMEKAKFGVLTVSDRASRGEYEDISGKYIIEYLHEVVSSPFEVVYRIVPDERELIEGALIHMADVEGCCLILTTGGTGPAPKGCDAELRRQSVRRCFGLW